MAVPDRRPAHISPCLDMKLRDIRHVGIRARAERQRFADKHARHDSHTTGRPSAQLNPPQVMAATDPICCRDPRNVMTASRPATYRSFLPGLPSAQRARSHALQAVRFSMPGQVRTTVTSQATATKPVSMVRIPVAIASYVTRFDLARTYVAIALPTATVLDLFARYWLRKRLHARRAAEVPCSASWRSATPTQWPA